MRKIKSFSLFESVDDVLDILPVVKDMLLDLGDLDYVTNCVVRRMDGCEYIRIGISKAVVIGDRYVFTDEVGVKVAFEWSDIKDVMNTIIEYLKSEGYYYKGDKGTQSMNGQPIVVTSGDISNYYVGRALVQPRKSRCEMWFEKIVTEI